MKPHKINNCIYLGIYKPEYMMVIDRLLIKYAKYSPSIEHQFNIFCEASDRIRKIFDLHFVRFSPDAEAYLQIADLIDDEDYSYYDVNEEYFRKLIDLALYESKIFVVKKEISGRAERMKNFFDDVSVKLTTIRDAWDGDETACEKLGRQLNPFEQTYCKDVYELYRQHTFGKIFEDEDLAPFGYESGPGAPGPRKVIFLNQLLMDRMFKCN